MSQEWAKEFVKELAEEIAGMACCLPAGDIQDVFERRRLLGLLEAGAKLQREGQRLVDWLDKLTVEAEREAKDNRFITLKEAHAADAKNFRATAIAMREAIKQAAAAKAVASEGGKND